VALIFIGSVLEFSGQALQQKETACVTGRETFTVPGRQRKVGTDKTAPVAGSGAGKTHLICSRLVGIHPNLMYKKKKLFKV
jgi:hypothetical protein